MKKIFGMDFDGLVSRTEEAERYGEAKVNARDYIVVEYDGVSVYYPTDPMGHWRGEPEMVIADGKVLYGQ